MGPWTFRPAVTWPYGTAVPGRADAGAVQPDAAARHGGCTCGCEGCQSNRDHCYNTSRGCLLCPNC